MTIIIDRRLNPGAKSLENRQRYLRRAKDQVRKAVREASKSRSIKDIMDGGEISMPIGSTEEPQFRAGQGGNKETILPGNKKFVAGDTIPRQQGHGSGARDSGGSTAEDMFRVILTRKEFLDLFLADLALPDMVRKSLASDVEYDAPHRAGYTTTGSPASMVISRTAKRALLRRVALHRPSIEEIEQLEQELEQCTDDERRHILLEQLEELKTRARRVPYIDPIDMRFPRFERNSRPIAQAVMFCLMDVSGSMSEHMKDLAKRFFMLLYVMLQSNYKQVEVVFIRHTDEAKEVDEETFFNNPETGGTKVSSALKEMSKIVKERYDPRNWNIYAAQASDGDNEKADNKKVVELLTGEILPIVQYFAYIEVSEPHTSSITPSTLAKAYESILEGNSFPFVMRDVSERSEIFPVFRELFKKKGVAA